MKQLPLPVSERKENGSTAVRRLRKAGKIPAVVYGRSGVRSLQVNRTDFQDLWKKASGGAALIQINDKEGAKTLAVLQQLQRDPVTDNILHIDFHEVSAKDTLTIPLPIHITGESVGAKNEGGVLEIHLHEVEIRCLPRDLPEFIELDVTELQVGESLHVRNLPALENVTYNSDPEATIVSCLSPRVSEPEDEPKDEQESDKSTEDGATQEDSDTPPDEAAASSNKKEES